MVFSSLLFLFRFLPVMLIAYFAAPGRLRNGILFLGSLFFYGWGEPVYIVLLLFSTAVDFTHGKLIGRFKEEGRTAPARAVLLSSVVINLGLLGFFKYFSGLPLPVGISFYTFQTMSYTIDVYRGNAKVQNNIIAFGAYVSMFPQLIAGPIVRYSTIEEELTGRKESVSQFALGVRYFVIGLGKKVLLANQMGALWTEIQGVMQPDRSVFMAWIGIFAFGMQIYYDFSGYSDMAVGLGHMFGFHFPKNFNYPYMAESITDFWRRWHISLGTWFKEYVYIPLGGNKKGKMRQVFNIMIVWTLTGIWHGAGMNYLLWGVYFGVLLLIEKLFLNRFLEKWPSLLRHGYAMFLVYLGWVLFVHEDMGAGIRFLGELFGSGVSIKATGRTWYLFWSNLPLMICCAAGATGCVSRIAGRLSGIAGDGEIEEGLSLQKGLAVSLFAAAVLIVTTAYLVNAGYNPFLYFRF